VQPVTGMARFENFRSEAPLKWCRRLRDLPVSSNAKLVGHFLAMHARPDGEQARPGVMRLAYETGASKSTVLRALKELESYGLIFCRERGSAGGRSGAASVYVLTVHDALDEWKTDYGVWLKQQAPPRRAGVSQQPGGPEQVSA